MKIKVEQGTLLWQNQSKNIPVNYNSNIKNLNKINERELNMGLAGTGKSWHKEYSDSAWIFIGGLPYDLTEGDVLAVFSQYGEIVNLNLVRDQKTGKFKGFGFLCYEDQRSTVLAVDNFNGMKLLGRTVRVDHCKDYKPPKDHGDEDDLTLKIREEGCAPKIQESSSEEQDDIYTKKKSKKEKKKKKKKMKKEKKSKKNRQESSSEEEVVMIKTEDGKKKKKNKMKKAKKSNQEIYSEQVISSSENSGNLDGDNYRDSSRSYNTHPGKNESLTKNLNREDSDDDSRSGGSNRRSMGKLNLKHVRRAEKQKKRARASSGSSSDSSRDPPKYKRSHSEKYRNNQHTNSPIPDAQYERETSKSDYHSSRKQCDSDRGKQVRPDAPHRERGVRDGHREGSWSNDKRDISRDNKKSQKHRDDGYSKDIRKNDRHDRSRDDKESYDKHRDNDDRHRDDRDSVASSRNDRRERSRDSRHNYDKHSDNNERHRDDRQIDRRDSSTSERKSYDKHKYNVESHRDDRHRDSTHRDYRQRDERYRDT